MSKSDFENFENLLLEQLKSDNKGFLSTIENNKKVIEACIDSQDLGYLKKFIYDFNTAVIEANVKKYKYFEQTLTHKLFKRVLVEFRKSNVLVRACKVFNKKAVEWLLTMKIDLNIQDENGVTALMYAAERTVLDFAVDKLIKGGANINMVDNNGNNVLFHATSSPDNLKKLLKTKIDRKQLNSDGENLLIYSCRHDKNRAFELLNKEKSFDPNQANCVGKTAAMYLVENGRFREVKSFVKENKIDPNYRNKFGNSLVSVYVQKFYQQYIGNVGETDYTSKYNYVVTKNYALTLLTLIDLGCDFNVPVDEDGNTAIIVFLLIKDYITAKYLLDHVDDIDLSIKNKYGINASYLSTQLDDRVFENLEYNKTRNAKSISYTALKSAIRKNDTFDPNCVNRFEDVIVKEIIKYNSPYPIKAEYAKICEQYIMEVFFPNAGGVINLGGNTHNVVNESGFGALMGRYNTGGLGTY